jgi:hypothetical protein
MLTTPLLTMEYKRDISKANLTGPWRYVVTIIVPCGNGGLDWLDTVPARKYVHSTHTHVSKPDIPGARSWNISTVPHLRVH